MGIKIYKAVLYHEDFIKDPKLENGFVVRLSGWEKSMEDITFILQKCQNDKKKKNFRWEIKKIDPESCNLMQNEKT